MGIDALTITYSMTFIFDGCHLSWVCMTYQKNRHRSNIDVRRLLPNHEAVNAGRARSHCRLPPTLRPLTSKLTIPGDSTTNCDKTAPVGAQLARCVLILFYLDPLRRASVSEARPTGMNYFPFALNTSGKPLTCLLGKRVDEAEFVGRRRN